MSKQQQAENYIPRYDALERKLNSLCGSGGWQGLYFEDAVATVRRLVGFYPQSLYLASIDHNELEIELRIAMVDGGGGESEEGETQGTR